MTAASASIEAISTEESKKYHEITALANDYASYLHADGFLQTQQFDDSIEELLTKLDEYHGLLDMIRSDTSLCLQKNLPLIRAKTKDMEKIFDKIDKLEAFVALVKKNMSVMEEKVSKAESELDTLHGFKKVLNAFPIPSFFASRPPATKQAPKYEAPNIFRTKDFIGVSSKERNADLTPSTKSALPVTSHKCDSQAAEMDSLMCPAGASSDGVSFSMKENHTNMSEMAPTRQTEGSSNSQTEVLSTSQSESGPASQSDLPTNEPKTSIIQKETCSVSDNRSSDISETNILVDDSQRMKTENMES